MRRFRFLTTLMLLFSAWFAMASPLGTGFTYQGELRIGGVPVNGSYDIQFALYQVSTGGSQVDLQTRDDVSVGGGVFTTSVDFTDIPFLTAQQYWIEVRVRDGASTGAYQVLQPRQAIMATPFALSARSVQSGGVVQGSIANGAVGTSQLASGAVGTGQLATSAITDAKIANGTITAAKLAFSAGDITSVIAGDGLQGGGASGDVTLSVNSAALQARVTGTCPVGKYFRGINVDGSVVCELVPGVPSGPTTLVSNGNTASTPGGLVITADGLPLFSYTDVTHVLKVAKCADSACQAIASVSVVDAGPNSVGEYSDMAVGGSGSPLVSYYDATAGALKLAACANDSCTGAATLFTIDDPSNSVGRFTSITIGNDLFPVISYWDATAGKLKVAKCSTQNCSGNRTISVVDASPNIVGEFNAITLGSTGNPVISYYDRTVGALKAAFCLDANCAGSATIRVVDSGPNNVGQYTSIGISGSGIPQIAYFDSSASSIKLATCSTPTCDSPATVSILDGGPGNIAAGHTAMAIGRDGLPIIAYAMAYPEFSLKVTKCANRLCSERFPSGSLSATAFLGYFGQIAIGNDNLPLIVARDVGNGVLKAVKCGTRSCQ